jgi:type I restriction enzyme S subunit
MSIQLVKLKDIIQKPLSGEWGEGEGDINVIRTTNFTNDGKLNLTNVVKRNIDSKKINQKQLIYGDTIIEKSGGSPIQPVGRVVYFEEKDGIFLCNNFTSLIRGKSQVDNRYLFWFLYNNHLVKNTLKYQNKTTGIINLQLERYIEDLQIPLPPLSTQKRIAEILDAADALKRKDQELLKKYDELAQAIFIDMFGDPVKNEKGWREDIIKNIASEEKHSIKAGPFGSSLKKEFYKKSGYKIYGQEQVIADDFTIGEYYIDEDKYQELKNCSISENDILISLVGTYGKISVVPINIEKGIINPRLMKISLNKILYNPHFFKYLLQTKQMYDRISTFSRGGTMDIVNVGIISKVIVIIPPLKMQDAFVEELNLVKKQMSHIEKDKKSDNLFQTLIQKAFNGELVN